MSVIMFSGVHGVGKGYFLEKNKNSLQQYKIYSASKLIEKYQPSTDAGYKKVSDVNHNQEILIRAIREEAILNETNCIIDGHLCIYNAKGEVERVPEYFFVKAGITGIVKEQVYAVEDKTWACPAGFYEMGRYLEQPDNEANYAELTEIIKNSVAIYDNEDPYKSILEEEFSKYFAGEQSEDTVIDHLKNRVLLYIQENNT